MGAVFEAFNVLIINDLCRESKMNSSVFIDIQICNVKPLAEGRKVLARGDALARVPDRVARFYQVNDVSKFQLDRPVHKPPIDKDNEFKVGFNQVILLFIF
jgi:dedicator of cytokinesis protein 3